ncbi:hypothetical protein Tco_0404873 [Tanacetum coccineum]
MSDLDESTVTYTKVSSPFEGLSDIGSPGVVGPEHEGLPWMLDDPYVQVALQAPPSPNYIPVPKEPQSPPLPDFVPEPVYPEFMPPEDEILPAEDQPLHAADSPNADSQAIFPRDDGDEEDESSEDDEDDDVDIEADDNEEEEEHPAPADSTVVALPAADQAPSAEETKLFETDKSAATPPLHPAYRVIARISIPALVPILVWSDAEVARLLAISTPLSSPLSPWLSPLTYIPFPPLPPIQSLSLPLSPPLPISAPPPASPIRPLGYRAVMIWLRAEAESTSHSLPLPPLSPIPAPTSVPPLILPFTNLRVDRPEVTLPPRKRLGIALGPRYKVGESLSAAATRPARGLRAECGFVATMDREIRHDLERDVGYGITDSWEEIVEAMQGTRVVTDVVEFSQRMTEFETRVWHDTYEVYTRLDDEQTERQLLAGRLNMLFRDRCAHARTARLMEPEARMSREAWGGSIDASDLTRVEETKVVHRGTEADKETSDSDDRVRETVETRQRSCTARCTRGGW